MQCVVDLFDAGEKSIQEKLSALIRKKNAGLTTWSEEQEIFSLKRRLFDLKEHKVAAEKMNQALKGAL